MIDSDMKKITNLLYMLAVLLLASCSDFLDKSPKNTVDPETTVTDDVAIALTNACYRTLQSSNMYNQRIWTLDIVAGNSLVGAGGGTDGLETIQASNFITQSDNGMALYRLFISNIAFERVRSAFICNNLLCWISSLSNVSLFSD